MGDPTGDLNDNSELTPADVTEIPTVAFTTFPDLETARSIAHALLEERLVACVNLVPGATSIYRWEGKVEESTEVIGIIKTAEDRVGDLLERLAALHPYDVPELVFLPVVAGNADYLDWILASTR